MSQKPPEQMTLLYLKKSSQVLSALTRLAVPEIAVPTGNQSPAQQSKNELAELSVLVGKELLVRDLSVTSLEILPPPPPQPPFPAPSPAPSIPHFVEDGVSFAATDLGVVTTDLVSAVLLKPGQYFIGPDGKPQLGADPTGILLRPTQTALTIELPLPVTANTGIWVQVRSGTLEQNITGEILITAPDLKKISIPVQLTPGLYHFLIMVAQYGPSVVEATVS